MINFINKNKKFFVIWGLLITAVLFISWECIVIYKNSNKQALISDVESYDRFFWNEYYSKNTIKQSYKIIIIGPEPTPNGRVVSDETLILRIVRAALNLNWEIKFYDTLMGKEDEVIDFNPDFIISTIPKWNMSSYIPLPYKIYSFIPLQYSTFFSVRVKEPSINYSSLKYIYNGFMPQIFTVSDGLILTDKKFLLFKELFEAKSKNKFHGIVGYPGVDYFDYDDSVEANKIIYYGINWDSLRSSKTYLDLYDNLAERGIVDYYGPFIGWINNYRNGWKGFLTLRNKIDDKGQPIVAKDDIVLETIKQHGIVLILHSDVHFDGDIPSLREFEAAAASSLIISDELPFVRETFGDSVLYIEVKNRTTKEIEDQIVKHYEWIKENPDKVKEMTKKAHSIYKEKFTLEKLLVDIAHMHESVLRDQSVNDIHLQKNLKLETHLKVTDTVIPAGRASY